VNYYNEIDPRAGAWLEELIALGEIPPGVVDTRSIEDVSPTELEHYDQCHFFAGIGGWPLALRLAGWPDDRPIWTGSVPCQPFSTAGKRTGTSDQRHLWPSWFWLVEQCLPSTIVGEQVSSPDALRWWDIVATDLEGAQYATGAVDLCAPGVGAYHMRQRLFWVANSKAKPTAFSAECGEQSPVWATNALAPCSRLGDTGLQGLQKPQFGSDTALGSIAKSSQAPWDNVWDNVKWVYCRDGKHRPIKPSILPVVDGVSASLGSGCDPSLQEVQNTSEGRVMRFKGYGNAIVPQLGAVFLQAVMQD
jgi:Site-specific DNA methylase